MGKDCARPLKCFTQVPEKRHLEIFESFWELGDWTSQNSYVSGCVKIVDIHRRYGKQGKAATSTPPRRNVSRHYYVNKEDGVSVRVCKKAFLAIHDISSDRVNRALENLERRGLLSQTSVENKSQQIKHLKNLFTTLELTL